MTEEVKQEVSPDPQVSREEKFHKEMGDAQTNTEFGIFKALKKKEPAKTSSMSGDVMFKDIQLFIPELIINVVLLVFGAMGIVLIRLFSQGFLNELQKSVTDQTYQNVAGHVLFLHNVTTIGIAIPVLFMLVMFLFKWFFFYPRGKKNFVIRSWKANIARISLEEIKDNFIKFDQGKELSDEMHVNFSNAAIDYYTGRKIILLEEGLSENTPLHQNIKTNEKVKDRGNVNASMFSAALKFCDYQNKKVQGFLNNPTNILLLVAIAIIIVIAFFVITKGSPTAAIQGVTTAMTARGA